MRVATSLAEINVVPLVDVMLVLLVIFMVTAPMMQQGLGVKLPQSKKSTSIAAPVTISVPLSFRQDKKVRLGKEAIGIDVLSERVRQATADQLTKNVIVAGDGGITLSETMQVFDSLKAAGIENVAIQTQPSTGGRAP
jgi:biopolymer transport protein TolR